MCSGALLSFELDAWGTVSDPVDWDWADSSLLRWAEERKVWEDPGAVCQLCSHTRGLSSLPADLAGLAVRAIDDLSDIVCECMRGRCRPKCEMRIRFNRNLDPVSTPSSQHKTKSHWEGC